MRCIEMISSCRIGQIAMGCNICDRLKSRNAFRRAFALFFALFFALDADVVRFGAENKAASILNLSKSFILERMEPSIAKGENEEVIELELDHDSEEELYDSEDNDVSDSEIEAALQGHVSFPPTKTKTPVKNWTSNNLRFLNPKTATRAMVMQDIIRAKEEDNQEDQETSFESLKLPRNSLEDFVLPKKPAPPKNKPISLEDWQEKVDRATKFLRTSELPYEVETNPVKKHRFLKSVYSKWQIIDGQIRYYHKRKDEDRGKCFKP